MEDRPDLRSSPGERIDDRSRFPVEIRLIRPSAVRNVTLPGTTDAVYVVPSPPVRATVRSK